MGGGVVKHLNRESTQDGRTKGFYLWKVLFTASTYGFCSLTFYRLHSLLQGFHFQVILQIKN